MMAEHMTLVCSLLEKPAIWPHTRAKVSVSGPASARSLRRVGSGSEAYSSGIKMAAKRSPRAAELSLRLPLMVGW